MITSRSARRGGCARFWEPSIPTSPTTSSPGRDTGGVRPCVDWPPLFAFLDEHQLPAAEDVRQIDFVTMSPGVSARAGWATIEAQVQLPGPERRASDARSRAPARFRNHRERGPAGTRPRRTSLPRGNSALAVELDGQILPGISLANDKGTIRIWLVRKGAAWSGLERASVAPRSRARTGTARSRRRSANRFVLVYGTRERPRRMPGRSLGLATMPSSSGIAAMDPSISLPITCFLTLHGRRSSRIAT